MSVLDILLGKPLATYEEGGEQIGVSAGIPIFGLDALSSAAYGPEAALTLLIVLGSAGSALHRPRELEHYFAARDRLFLVPADDRGLSGRRRFLHGGVAKPGASHTGLLAAAALMLDYILVVAVGISAGVGALVSAVPQLQPHTLAMCLGILVLITLVNLRGVRESGRPVHDPDVRLSGLAAAGHRRWRDEDGFRGGPSCPVVAAAECRASCRGRRPACGCCCRFSRTAARP